MVIARFASEVSMPKQNFNSGLEGRGPHRQGEKGGKGGEIEKVGKSTGDGSAISGNKQVGPFNERDDDKRPRVSSEDRKSGDGS
jgi:hypothetical protein